MDIPLSKTESAVIAALRELGEGWHNRTAIAQQLGKNRLNPVDTTALDLLAVQGTIERQLVQGSRPNVNQWQYRVKG